MRNSKIGCNNFSECHEPIIIGEDSSATYVICTHCNEQERIGKDTRGEPERRLYGDWFKKDFLQPGPPLYYKYAGAKEMHV